MSLAEDLEHRPFEAIDLAIHCQGRNPGTGEITTFRLTDAASLFTEPDDTEPSIFYHNVVIEGMRTKRRLADRGTFSGGSSVNVAAIELQRSFDESSRVVDEMSGLDFQDQPFVVLGGARTLPDGTPFPFSRFEPIFTGVSLDFVELDEGNWELEVTGLSSALDLPVVEDFYQGWGGQLAGDVDHRLSVPDEAAWDLPGGLTIEAFGVLDALPAAFACTLRRVTDYGHFISSTGELALITDGATVTLSGHKVTPGDRLAMAVTVAPLAVGFAVKFYAGTKPEDYALVGSGTIPALPMTAGELVLGPLFGVSMAYRRREDRLWDYARTFEELIDNAFGPISAPQSQAGLVECFKWGEGVPPVLGKGEVDPTRTATLTDGAAFYEGSAEGDDPDQFPDGAGVFGQRKGLVMGRASNVLLAGVDSQFHLHGWSAEASSDISRLYTDGAPMPPEDDQVAADGISISLDGTGDTIDFSPASGLTGHRFIPRQPLAPARPGQLIEVDDTVATTTYRAQTVSDDGLQIGVVGREYDDAGDSLPAGLPTVALPTGSTVRTSDVHNPYIFDLSRSLVDLRTGLEGELTADIVGLLLAGESKASDLFRILADVAAARVGQPAPAIDQAALFFDGEVGLVIEKDTDLTFREAMRQIMESVLGWFIEGRNGGYSLGNHAPPSGEPVATIFGDIPGLHALPNELVAPIVAGIHGISPHRTVVPTWQLRTGYGKTWHTQSLPAGRFPLSRREQVGKPYRYATRSRGAVRQRYPLREPREPFETLLATRAAAEGHLDVATPLYMGERQRFWDVDIEIGFLTVSPGDVIAVQHSAHQDLTGGRLARILAQDDDTSTGLTSLEIFA